MSAASQELVRVPQPILPMSPDQASGAMAAYQELTRSVLTADDWQGIPGRDQSFVKRTGWQKLANFYSVSTELRSEEVERDEDGNLVRARVIVRAIHPSGRYADGDGACSVTETRFRSEKGRQKVEHDLSATATTRATNRAISNLIGFGAVSAEEVDEGPPEAAHGVPGGFPPQGQTTDDDQQLQLAAGAITEITGLPDPQAARFVLDMGKHFDGVPVACITMLRSLARRVAETKVVEDTVRATATADPEQVYPPATGGGRRYAGD